MTTPTTGKLTVPGAGLHYEVRGTGPVLLLISGGNGDCGVYDRMADVLAGRYTVVSYDRRGFSRSPLDGPVDDQRRLAADVDDAHRLLGHLTGEPAHVFGSSSGAIVALHFFARYPDQVATLIAHEPPAVTLLPDAAHWLDLFDDVYETYRRSGVKPAMRKFSAAVGMDDEEPPAGMQLPPAIREMISRVQGNLGFWLEHELRQYPRATPDIAALKTVSERLVLAGGQDSREYLPYRPSTVLSEQLGNEIVDFPGDHIGYVKQPAEFAAQLVSALRFG